MFVGDEGSKVTDEELQQITRETDSHRLFWEAWERKIQEEDEKRERLMEFARNDPRYAHLVSA